MPFSLATLPLFDITHRFQEGFVNETWSREQEFHKDNHSKLAFLWGGRRPQVGLRVEMDIIAKEDARFRLSGIISYISPVPTDLELYESNSSNWHVEIHAELCETADTCIFLTGSPLEKRDAMLMKYGAIHGQRIKVLAILSLEFNDFFIRPIARDEVVEVTLVCDDNKENIWQVEGIESIYDDDSLPTYFCHFMEWFGYSDPCECIKCLSTLKKVSIDRCARHKVIYMDKIRPNAVTDVVKSSVVSDDESEMMSV